MKIEVKGSKEQTYVVDSDKLTCTCPHFKFRCKDFGLNDPNRMCKHLKQAAEEHSELFSAHDVPVGTDPDGKVRHPREEFIPYVSMIHHVMELFSSCITRYEICGSWRREAKRVSDLDVLMVVNDLDAIKQFQTHIKEKYSPIVRWEGDLKSTYVFDDFCQIDFKVVEDKHWPFATLHFTGSKDENVRLRKIAVSMGYSLSEYGLCDNSSVDGAYRQMGILNESEIYEFLNQPYKQPKER